MGAERVTSNRGLQYYYTYIYTTSASLRMFIFLLNLVRWWQVKSLPSFYNLQNTTHPPRNQPQSNQLNTKSVSNKQWKY